MAEVNAQTTEIVAADTRDVIVKVALECFRDYGMRKTTIVDIAREAGVSRSTFYEYFRDKAAIVEATAESVSQRFYRELARAMERGDTLEEKLSRAAVTVTTARQIVEPEKYFDADEVRVMLTKNAEVLLQECTDFLAPYITAAKLTGEVRKDLDVKTAGEWCARMLISLFTTPSLTLDMSDATAVAEFMRAYVVRGFAEGRSRPRRTLVD
ncbi:MULTISPECIES: helix-turn-helix domain-containing protein [unclassified Mycobacterium]|uniref:TetR/AcrR family transcriptional regulator n=1 Tax=unclassified Mycobacterium TaxID=2642494 RepID=UPI0029C860B2|nr:MULTISPECIES: helix-turn-helix domain-containing protein [unclassified Mycobacterium]